MQKWQLWHSRAGYHVELAEVPWWALALSRVAERVDVATGCVLCGAHMPNFLWKVPVGKPEYDESVVEPDDDPFLVNSLAGVISNFFNWAFSRDVMCSKSLLYFPVSEEVAKDLGWVSYDETEEDL